MTRQPCIGSAPRVDGYVASKRTGFRLGRVEQVDADEVQADQHAEAVDRVVRGVVVDGVWISYDKIYPCPAP